jgi:hypothetical protein
MVRYRSDDVEAIVNVREREKVEVEVSRIGGCREYIDREIHRKEDRV